MGKHRGRLNDYEVNRSEYEADAIVYQSATGRIRVWHEDIAAEKKDFSEEAFLSLKEESNEIYAEIESGDHAERRRCYLVDEFSRYACKASASYGEKARTERLAMHMDNALELLTEAQKRRLDLYYSSKMTLRKIAEQEHVDHKAVQRSLAAAQKEIKDYFLKLNS